MEDWVIQEFKGEFSFLSNFFLTDIEYNEKILKLLNLDFKPGKFRSLEHAYQAAKTKFFEEFEKIRFASSPGKAKVLANKIKSKKIHFRKDWYKINIQLMEELLRIK